MGICHLGGFYHKMCWHKRHIVRYQCPYVRSPGFSRFFALKAGLQTLSMPNDRCLFIRYLKALR